MNFSTKTLFALIVFSFFSAFVFGLSGSSTSYELNGIQASSGSSGSSTSYDVGLTQGYEQYGSGSSTSYDLCLGYWCPKEAEIVKPCVWPTVGGEDWIIPAGVTVECVDVTIQMPTDSNLIIQGNLKFSKVNLFMNSVSDGSSSITVENTGSFSTFDIAGSVDPQKSVIKTGKTGKQYLFMVYGGIDIENSEIGNVGFKDPQSPDQTKYGIYLAANSFKTVKMIGNNIHDTIYGLYLKSTSNAIIQGNTITVNKVGGVSVSPYAIYLQDSHNDVFYGNKLYFNDNGNGVYSWTSGKNKYTSNEFMSNNPSALAYQGFTASNDNIILDSSYGKPGFTTTQDSDFTREWFHNVFVYTTKNCVVDKCPVPGALVTITPKYKYSITPDVGPQPNGPEFKHVTGSNGKTEVDETIQYDQLYDQDNEAQYNPYKVNACLKTPTGDVCNEVFPNIDASKTTEVELDVGSFGCELTPIPATVNYPVPGTNKISIKFESIYAGLQGKYYCGVNDPTKPEPQPTEFTVPASLELTVNCPEDGKLYPGEGRYQAAAWITGSVPAYCTGTTTVKEGVTGRGVTLTANPSSALEPPLSSTLTATFTFATPPVGTQHALFTCGDTAAHTYTAEILQGATSAYTAQTPVGLCVYTTEGTFTAKVEWVEDTGNPKLSTTTTIMVGEAQGTTYPSDVSFLSAACPVGLVFSDTAKVTGYLVARGKEICSPDVVWKFWLTRPAQPIGTPPEELTLIPACIAGKNVFTLTGLTAEGAYGVRIAADTSKLAPEQKTGPMESSCNFRVLKQPPSKFPDLPLLLAAVMAGAVFIFLSRYSKNEGKKSKK